MEICNRFRTETPRVAQQLSEICPWLPLPCAHECLKLGGGNVSVVEIPITRQDNVLNL